MRCSDDAELCRFCCSVSTRRSINRGSTSGSSPCTLMMSENSFAACRNLGDPIRSALMFRRSERHFRTPSECRFRDAHVVGRDNRALDFARAPATFARHAKVTVCPQFGAAASGKAGGAPARRNDHDVLAHLSSRAAKTTPVGSDRGTSRVRRWLRESPWVIRAVGGVPRLRSG